MSNHATPHLHRTVLGSFRLLRVLGQGAFATAYLAEQVGTDRKAVVKIAHAHLIHSDQGKMVRDRFASEVRASTRVSHPNLVTIYTAGETDDKLPALAMEYLEGETLGHRLRSGERLTADEVHRCFVQLASALERVHASRIIHRDVSPENVFLTRGHDGLVLKLLDFGIARLQDLPSLSNFAVGTPLYMALEQMKGAPTPASDVYSVGALLWWCVTGEELHGRLSEFIQLLYALENQQEPPDARAVCATIPPGVAALLGAMLHRDAARRPTIAAFAREWSALEPEFRAWWSSQPQTGRRVAVLLAHGSAAHTLVAALQREGNTVLRLEPRVSTVLAHPELDAVIIDADLPEPDPLSLARHLESVLSGVPLFAVSTRPFAAAWQSVPLRLRALLPEQLPALIQALADDGPAAVPHDSGEFAHRALGEIPELLAVLEEAVAQHDEGAIAGLCERIERIAHLAALDEMASLARTFRVLFEAHAVDQPAGFVEQLNRSFRESFPTLLAAQKQ